MSKRKAVCVVKYRPCFEALEPRCFLSGTVLGTYTDPDGDVISIGLSGPGMGQVQFVNNNPAEGVHVSLAGTGIASKLSITARGGGGSTVISSVTVDGSLGAVAAPSVDLIGDLTLTGSLKSLVLRDIGQDSEILIGGAGALPADSLSFTARHVLDTRLASAIPIKSMSVASWIDATAAPDQIESPSMGKLSVKGKVPDVRNGRFEAGIALSDSALPATLGKVTIAGQVAKGHWRVNGHAAGIAIGSSASDWAAGFAGNLKLLSTTAGDLQGVVTAASFNAINVTGHLGATLLAGADLGQDMALGGENENADTFEPGWIGKLSVRGSVNSAVIGAGLDPGDSRLQDSDDVVLGSPFESYIKSFSVLGGMSFDAYIRAAQLPASAKVAGLTLAPAHDGRFQPVPGFTDGAQLYLGAYELPEFIAYRDAFGVDQLAFAYPGQVQAFVAPGLADEEAEAVFQGLGATLIAQVPHLGYYLLGVSPGDEAALIDELYLDPDVLSAMPNHAVERGFVDLDVIAENDGSIPLVYDFNPAAGPNTFVYVVDDFVTADGACGDPPTHGNNVSYVASQGLTGSVGQVNLFAQGQPGTTLTMDHWMASIAVAAQDVASNPLANAVINVSLAGAGGASLSDEDYAQNIGNLLHQFATTLDALVDVDPAVSQRIVMTVIAGNGNPHGVDLHSEIEELHADFPRVFPTGPGAGGPSLIIVGGTEAGNTNVDTTMNYSSAAGEVVYAPANDIEIGPDGCTGSGTSFAAPAVANLLAKAMVANPGLTASQVSAAFMKAYAEHGSLPSLSQINAAVTGVVLPIYSGTFSGFTIDSASIPPCVFKDTVSGKISIAIAGGGTEDDPYFGTITIQGQLVITVVQNNDQHICHGDTIGASGFGSVSGDLGAVHASIDGQGSNGDSFTVTFSNGVISGNKLTGDIEVDLGLSGVASIQGRITLARK